MTPAFLERVRPRGWGDERIEAHYRRLLGELVTVVDDDRVGRPGFFSRLADTVDFNWTCHFAIEGGIGPPVDSLRAALRQSTVFLGPFEALPADVVLVARDIDAAYQDYCFRDDWMFDAVHTLLRGRGLPATEVTSWPR